jgi:hypothetical protein
MTPEHEEPMDIAYEILSSDHPSPSSGPTLPHGAPTGFCSSRFDEVRAHQQAYGTFPFGPFKSRDEWEFVEWAVESGLSQEEIDKLVSLKVVSTEVH